MAYPEKKKRNDRIEKMYKMGIGLRPIARMEGIRHQTVMEILERRGLRNKVGVGEKSR